MCGTLEKKNKKISAQWPLSLTRCSLLLDCYSTLHSTTGINIQDVRMGPMAHDAIDHALTSSAVNGLPAHSTFDN